MARPPEFDRQDILEKAMDVFWKSGFGGTSVTDLVNATNLKPGSIYGAFSSKRGLFLEVIDAYASRSLARIDGCLQNNSTPLEAVHAFFNKFAQDISADPDFKGCLMVNTMLEMANEDDDVRIKVTSYLSQIEKRFEQALTDSIKLKQLPESESPQQIARFLMSSIWGLRVLSTTRPDPSAYQAVVSQILKTIPLPK